MPFNLEYFRDAVSYYHKKKDIYDLQQLQIGQTDRVTKLEKKKQDAEANLERLNEQTKLLKSHITKLENQLAQEEKSLSSMESFLTTATDAKQIEKTQENIDKHKLDVESLEDQILTEMDSVEEVAKEIEKLQTFLNGIDETIAEISQEVETEVKKLDEQIEELSPGLNTLIEKFPPSHQDIIESGLKKFFPKSPFARIDNRHCSLCRFSIDAQLAQDVTNCVDFYQCPGCDRILIPSS